MEMISTNASVIGPYTTKCYFGTKIVFSCCTMMAIFTWDAGFDGDAVTGLEMFDVCSDGEYLAGAFVAEDVVVFYDAGSYCSRFPEMEIGSRDRVSNVFGNKGEFTYPQIPFTRTCTTQSSGPRWSSGDGAL